MNWKWMSGLVVGSILSFAPGVLAQSAVDGAIGGTVEDAAGAGVAGAKVTVRNNGTNAEQQLVSDSSGFFRVIHLQPGLYTVSVAAPGFTDFSQGAVEVTVGSLTDVSPHLGVEGAKSVVDVSAEAPQINTTNNDFSDTIGLKVLEDLPVNNYRWSSYALLTPGVVADANGFGLLSFRGQSTLLNNITFDGADDNQAFFSEERGRTRVGYSTAKASILEFQVNTSNYSVEYGRSAGGVVNAVTRSGTNAFHGEMYFFDRDAEWGAKNPFTTRAVQVSSNPITFQNQVFKPKDWRKQSGIGIGGPIVKDKLFFFFAFDDFKRNFPGVSAPSNPTFFYAPAPATAPGTNGTCAGTTTATVGGGVCQLAANLNGLKTVSSVTAAQYSAAVTTYSNGIAGLTSITGLTPRTGDQNIFFPKIDWQINGKNHVTLEVNRLRWTSPAGIQTGTSALNYGIASFGNDYVKSTFGIAKLDTLITQSLSNEIRYQYGRDFEYEFNQTPTSYEASNLLMPSSGPGAGYVNPYGIPPNVNISNAFQFGTATFLNRPAYPDERRWQVSDTANLVRGHHNLKFGLDLLHTYDLSENLTSQYGAFTYGGSNYLPYVEYLTDLNKANGCFSTTGVAQECYTNYAQGFGPLGFQFTTFDYAGFAQDEWKVTPRLSLTLGVRYEYEQTPSPQIPNTVTTSFAAGSTSNFPDNRGNVAPRAGFAWDVYGTGKTVVRGGYGLFYARLINSTIYNAIAQTGNPAGQQTVSFATSTATAASLGSPVLFPTIINPTRSLTSSGAVNLFYFDKNFKLPQIEQADLGVEQALGYKTTLSLTWLSAFGRRLPDFVDTNLPTAKTTVSYTVSDPTQLGPLGNGTRITIPYYYGARPLTAYGATTDIFSGVNSNYEGLVAEVKHQTTKNLSFDANYTWSHALDYGENNTTFTNTNSVLDPNNLRGEYGNSNQNVPNRLVLYAIYNTPSHFGGVRGYLLNNYEISPSFQAQSGLPYTAALTGNASGVVLDNGFANTTTGYTPASTAGGVNGTNGTARVPILERNVFQYRRDILLDMRVSKRFRVRDRVDIELLGESFNLANHQNVTNVNATAYSLTAGSVSARTPNLFTYNTPFSTVTNVNSNLEYSPRQVQLGARVQF